MLLVCTIGILLVSSIGIALVCTIGISPFLLLEYRVFVLLEYHLFLLLEYRLFFLLEYCWNYYFGISFVDYCRKGFVIQADVFFQTYEFMMRPMPTVLGSHHL